MTAIPAYSIALLILSLSHLETALLPNGSPHRVQDEDATPQRIAIGGFRDGERTWYLDLNPEDMADNPEWNPEESSAPIQASEAISLARDTLDQLINDGEVPSVDDPEQGWHVKRLTLEPWSLEKHSWFWVVRFHRKDKPRPFNQFGFVILMNGEIRLPTPY